MLQFIIIFLPSSGLKLAMLIIPTSLVVFTAVCICAFVGIRGSRQGIANVAAPSPPAVKIVTHTMTATDNTAPPPYPASAYPSYPAYSPPPYPAEPEVSFPVAVGCPSQQSARAQPPPKEQTSC